MTYILTSVHTSQMPRPTGWCQDIAFDAFGPRGTSYAADCRERGTKATRTAIVRALVEALESGKVDISKELIKG